MEAKMNIDQAILYLSGKISKNDKIVFETWLRGSDANYSYFDEFKKYWELTGKAYSDYSSDTIKGWEIVNSNTIKKDIDQHKAIPLAYRILKVAASVLILISLGISGKFLYNWWQHEDFESFYSDNNIVTVSLSDGSTVWLNTQSELLVPKIFKGHKRNVYFKGEAFFEVAKNPRRPFKVYANGTTTQVLGTSFNLKALDSARIVSLTVVTGEVSFSLNNNKSKNLILFSGQKGLFDILNGKLQMDINKNVNFLAWKTGKLQFNNASLDEVCDVLHEYYKIKITPGTYSHTKQYSFTGNFDNASIKDVLTIIEHTLGVKFVKTGDTLYVQ